MYSHTQKQRVLCLWRFWAPQLNSCNQSGSCLALKGHFEVLVKGNDLYLHGLADMVWSVPGNLWLSFGVAIFVVPLTRKTLPSSANICWPWQMNSKDFEACFAVESSNADPKLLDFPQHPQSLVAFLRHLEENAVVGVNIEVHELKYTQSEDVLQPGKKVSDYFVKPVEECFLFATDTTKEYADSVRKCCLPHCKGKL